MIEYETRVKKWGNSLGILLPKDVAGKNRISADQKIRVFISKIDQKNAAQKIWGAMPHWEKSSEELEQEVDGEFDLKV